MQSEHLGTGLVTLQGTKTRRQRRRQPRASSRRKQEQYLGLPTHYLFDAIPVSTDR